MEKFYKKQIKLWEKVYEDWNNSESWQRCLNALPQYVYNGTEEFTFREEIFPGYFKDLHHDSFQLYGFCNDYFQAKAVLEFEENNDYSKLLEGYYHHILYIILGEKHSKFELGWLEYDFSLLLIFTITYFPQYTSIVGKHLVKFLKFRSELLSELNLYRKKYHKMFGFSNVIWLSVFVCKWYGFNDLAKEIQNYFDVIADSPYQLATENLLCTDAEIVNTWIAGLSDFHIKNSKDNLTLPFNNYYWQYYPIEIIALLEIRQKENISNEIIKNDFIKRFLPHIGKYSSIEFDELTRALTTRIIGDND